MAETEDKKTTIPEDPIARARFLAEIEEQEMMRESLLARIPQLKRRMDEARKAGNEEEAEELRQKIDSIHKKIGGKAS